MTCLQKNIRLLLRARGMTQRQLAEASGIGAPHLNRVLNTDAGITLTTAVELADAFGITVSELLDENLEKILALPA